MKSRRKIVHLIALYAIGFIVSLAAYIVYTNQYINPPLSDDIDKLVFARYEFLNTGGTSININEQFDDKIKLVDFWTLNCSFCTDDLEQFYNLDLSQNPEFVIVAINQDTFDNWQKYLEENDLHEKSHQIVHLNLLDEKILRELEVEYFPTYFLLDEEGFIRSRCSYNFVFSRINRVLTNKAYFKDYLYDIKKYFPCGGLGRPTIAYSIIIYPIIAISYFLITKRGSKNN